MMVEEEAPACVEGGDCCHIIVRQSKIENVKVFLHALNMCCLLLLTEHVRLHLVDSRNDVHILGKVDEVVGIEI